MTFDHVADKIIRSVLNGEASEDALPYALDVTIWHAEADQANQDVPFSVSEQRLALAIDASEWWDVGNKRMALQCLREAWVA